jgi:hypothetical protein
VSDPTIEPIHLHLPGEGRFVRLARLVGAGMANELGLDVDGLDDVRLAVGEACSLALQLGASSLGVDFSLDGQRLIVDVDAPLLSLPADDLDPQSDLAEQILKVACTSHAITHDDHRWTARLTFDGR